MPCISVTHLLNEIKNKKIQLIGNFEEDGEIQCQENKLDESDSDDMEDTDEGETHYQILCKIYFNGVNSDHNSVVEYIESSLKYSLLYVIELFKAAQFKNTAFNYNLEEISEILEEKFCRHSEVWDQGKKVIIYSMEQAKLMSIFLV